MENLKDVIKNDIAVFLNLDEFAENRAIDGETIKCILDEDAYKERNIKSETRHFEGVYKSKCALFVRDNDIEKPSIGESMNIDGFLYLVTDVLETEGIYEIGLTRNDY